MNSPTCIVVVDDDSSVRIVLQKALAGADREILAAPDGAEALQLVHDRRPDLVLSDVVMPGMDGLELCRRIKQTPELAGIIVILTSGLAVDAQDCVNGFDAGADEYLLKPFQIRELQARVKAMLRLHRAEAALRDVNRDLDRKFRERTDHLELANHRLSVAIEEQFQIMQSLRESEARFRSLVETAGVVIVGLTPDHRIFEWNGEAERVFDCSRAEVLGQDYIVRFLPEDARAEDREEFQRLCSGTTVRQYERAVRRKDGTERVLIWRATPLTGPEGQISGVIACGHDITERQAAERELQLLPQRLREAAEEERRRVAADLHDGIGQIITAVRFRLRGLQSSLERQGLPDLGEVTDQAQEHLARATEEVRRIAHNLRPSVLDDLGFLSAINEVCIEFGERTGIRVDMGSSRLPTRLPSDLELALYRLVQESLANIEKHAQAGSVQVSLTQMGGNLRLQVRDDGQGFAPELEQRQHAGLGLINMRARVAQFGGRFQLRSAPAEGTEISVRIPLGNTPKTT